MNASTYDDKTTVPEGQSDDPRDQVVMESGGTTEMGDPNYVENDDVRDSIAEGYF